MINFDKIDKTTVPIDTVVQLTGTYTVNFGNTGLFTSCFLKGWIMHFLPDSHDEKVLGREVEFAYRLLLGLDALVNYWEETAPVDNSPFSSGWYANRPEMIIADPHAEIHNYFLLYFNSIDKAIGIIDTEPIYEVEYAYPENSYFRIHLHLDRFAERVNLLKSTLSLEDLLNIRYFKRLNEAKIWQQINNSKF